MPATAEALNAPLVILGVAFDPVILGGAVDRIEAMIATGRPHYVVTPNVDYLVRVKKSRKLHGILAHASLVLCDGMPVVWASRWLGDALPGRVAGSDLAPILLKRAAERGWRVFLLGGAPGVADEAARRISLEFPSIPEVAHYSPPHADLQDMDNAEIARRVRAAHPDLMLVCFGCPKQEIWMSENYRTLDVPVMIGAGATIDFLAGRVARAPAWMRRCGAEWLFRLLREPVRLFGRYSGGILNFVPAILAQIRLTKRPREP